MRQSFIITRNTKSFTTLMVVDNPSDAVANAINAMKPTPLAVSNARHDRPVCAIADVRGDKATVLVRLSVSHACTLASLLKIPKNVRVIYHEASAPTAA
jgi:hypothetical protein